MRFSILSVVAVFNALNVYASTNIILSNDDGWAELNIRQFFDALVSHPYKFNVVLVAPSENKSGTGSTDVPPTVLNTTCEFDTCPVGSPPEGFNASNPRFNYVNSFPVTSMNFGIDHVVSKFFKNTHGKPQLAVAGFNVGLNSGQTTLISGTVGASTAAALKGIPAIAFSGATGSQVSFTSPLSENNYALVYAQLSAFFTNAVLQGANKFPLRFQPILPHGIWLNVNLSPSTNDTCTKASEFKFIMTRINDANSTSGPDIDICNNGKRLPTENSILNSTGCFVTVSVGEASTKADVNAATQLYAFERFKQVLSCPSK